jgi:hypothetical protein
MHSRFCANVAEIFGEVLRDARCPRPPIVRFAILGAGADVFEDALLRHIINV